LLAASLCRRNSNEPSADTHFPIFGSDQDMIDPLTGIEGKKWLSQSERAAIKELRPYKGGDHTIWPLHKLDILRKHDRLLSVHPDVRSFLYQRGNPADGRGLFISGFRGIERLENKMILSRIGGPAVLPFSLSEGAAHVAAHVTFNEPDIGVVDEEVATTLLRFGQRVSGIIKLFDTP
jgi:hypothetical protein